MLKIAKKLGVGTIIMKQLAGGVFILSILLELINTTTNQPAAIYPSGGKKFISLSVYPTAELEKKLMIPNQEVYITLQGDQCWDSPLPCSPYYDSRLEMRGETLKEGFRKWHK